MPTLNEVKYAALQAATGGKGTLNELELSWLGTKLGEFTGTLNERWYKEFLLNGVATKVGLPWNENAYIYLGEQGATGKTLNERWYQFWANA